MLTKLEITQKKAKSEQLDLVSSIDSADKIRKKRLFVITAITLTIGLSLAFWIYRSLKSITFSVPKLPPISVQTKSDIDSQISTILGKDQFKWEIDLTSPLPVPNNLKKSSNSLIKSLLPEGLDVKEDYKKTDTSQTLTALVSTPKKIIYFSLKYNSGNQSAFTTTLSKLVPAIYWSKVQEN